MNDEQRDEILTEIRLDLLGLQKDLEKKVEGDEKDFRELWRAIKDIKDLLKPLVKQSEADSSVGSWRSSQLAKWAIIIPILFTMVATMCAGLWNGFKWLMEQ